MAELFATDSMTIEALEAISPTQVPDPNIGATAPTHKVITPERSIQASGDTAVLTPIQEFYNGVCIFVTGGTGFMGKILIEKILRSCPDVRCIYLLIRTKKGKNMHSRVEDIFDDVVFDRLKEEQPKFRHKVQGIAGDCSLPDLGISNEDIELLKNEVAIVFHAAATVRFDEKLKLACTINVKGTQDLVKICAGMKNLKAFIHVSTAYANCQMNQIDEQFYTPPIDSKKIVTLADTIPETMLDNMTETLLDRWPNTYAFTKAIAEDVVRQDAVDLPLGIFRPAIVISTYKEPLEGWIDNMYGPTGVCAAAGNGLMRTLYADPQAVANIVPVDMSCNALIASAWDVYTRHTNVIKNNKVKKDEDVPIYNYVSSVEQTISWGEFMHYTEKHGLIYPSIKAIWYYGFSLNKNWYIHWLYILFLHYLPALLIDTATFVIGKQPRLMKIYGKVHKFMLVISYFSTRVWRFTNDNTQNLWIKLSKEDKELFFFDMKQLDWEDYFMNYLKGIRIYLLKDPMTTLASAKRRWNRLFVLHLVVKYGSLLLLFRILWFIIQSLYDL